MGWMRNPDGDAERDADAPDWSHLEAYGDHQARWRRFAQRTRTPPSLRRSPRTPRFTVAMALSWVLMLALGALAVFIIIAAMPRTHHWADPQAARAEAGTAAKGWLAR